ncbi:hypothetical protein TanjilG_17387 [Lupinus angustifolius]|uniref:Uncharacterized protein n=1 Tax=Lupinus angustifolius TaxID=3871 RepID=A0A4P1R1B7_LUPAN|nr:hypothetical protein TanjilG_17387 [Lupinus angustifolius]
MSQSQQQRYLIDAIWLSRFGASFTEHANDMQQLERKRDDYFSELLKYNSKYGSFINPYESIAAPLPPPPLSPPLQPPPLPLPPPPPRLVQSHKRTLWSEEEHNLFIDGLRQYGRGKWKSISTNVLPSKTPSQIASHAQKYFLRQAASEKKRRSIHDDNNINNINNNKMMMIEPNHNHNCHAIVPIEPQELPHAATTTNAETMNTLAYTHATTTATNAEALNSLVAEQIDDAHAATTSANPVNSLGQEIEINDDIDWDSIDWNVKQEFQFQEDWDFINIEEEVHNQFMNFIA